MTPTLPFPPSVDASTPYTPERPPFVLLGLKVVPPRPLLLFELPSTPSPKPVLKPASPAPPPLFEAAVQALALSHFLVLLAVPEPNALVAVAG